MVLQPRPTALLVGLVLGGAAVLPMVRIDASRPPATHSWSAPQGQLVATRWVLAHGRNDGLRALGLQVAGSNPGGAAVPGVPGVIAAIAGNLVVTLGVGPNGLPIPATPPNPIVAAAASLPSGMTLAVLQLGPNSPPVSGGSSGWEPLSPRFGTGNYYATVSIPANGIRAGQELVTKADFDGYAANSILFEAPDFGDIVMPWELEGGTTNIRCFGEVLDVGWANPLELQLFEQTQVRVGGPKGWVRILIRAALPRSFSAVRTIRWAAEANQVTVISTIPAPAVPPTGFSWFVVTLPGAVSGMVKLSAVAAEGPFPPGPFLTPQPPPPQHVALDTFHASASTLEDAITIDVSPFVPRFFTWQPLLGVAATKPASEIRAPTDVQGNEGISSRFRKDDDLEAYVALTRWGSKVYAESFTERLLRAERKSAVDQTRSTTVVLRDRPHELLYLQYSLNPGRNDGEMVLHLGQIIGAYLYKDRYHVRLNAYNMGRWPDEHLGPRSPRQLSQRLRSAGEKALAAMMAYAEAIADEWDRVQPELGDVRPGKAPGGSE